MSYFATRAFLQLLRRHPPTASRGHLSIPLISRCWFLYLIRKFDSQREDFALFPTEEAVEPCLGCSSTTSTLLVSIQETNEPGLVGWELLRISRTKGFVRWHQKVLGRRVVVVAGSQAEGGLKGRAIDDEANSRQLIPISGTPGPGSYGIGNRNWRSSRTGYVPPSTHTLCRWDGEQKTKPKLPSNDGAYFVLFVLWLNPFGKASWSLNWSVPVQIWAL